jgi:hypothetical protein
VKLLIPPDLALSAEPVTQSSRPAPSAGSARPTISLMTAEMLRAGWASFRGDGDRGLARSERGARDCGVAGLRVHTRFRARGAPSIALLRGRLRIACENRGMGPITIFDKSALQALSMDEAVWFQAFFSANVVPVFYVETLADLEKSVAEGRTPEDVVGMLADKTPYNAVPNVHHRQMVLGEFAGHRFEMTLGRPIIGAGETKRATDGTIGLHVEEFPEAATLLRWRSHEFLEIERAAAKEWRAELGQQDPARTIGGLKNVLPPDGKCSELAQLKRFVDSFCSTPKPEVFALALDVLDVPKEYRQVAFNRWLAAGQPPLNRFAPYATHVFKVDLLFYLGIDRGFISADRASNKVDMAYLYYLPFTMIFVSRDKLHHRTAPLFLRANQTYLRGEELKVALREIDEHYDALPEQIKQLGVMAIASYPPSDMDNVVTQQWDKHMHPDWRERAKAYEAERAKPRDEAADRETVAELNRKLDDAQPVLDEQAGLGQDGPDYVVIRREIPATKGKWRMVSRAVEEAGRDG